MNVFRKKYTLEEVNHFCKGCMVEHLGIEITEIGDDYLKGTMPVDNRTKQPLGILHGGASVVLAETLGSIAGNLACSSENICIGMEINANHLSKMTEGEVVGIAKAVHIGGRTQVWEIRINNEGDRKVCISRLTLAVVEKKQLGLK